MVKMFEYIPKQFLLVACMAGSLGASDSLNLQNAPIDDLVATVYEDGFSVLVGNDSPALLTTMKEICGLADSDDAVIVMAALIERLEQGHIVVPKDMIFEALDESFTVLERHHTSIQPQEHFEQIVNTLSEAWDSVFSVDRWVCADDEEEIIRSGCCNDKSKRFCNIISGRATIGSLTVTGNETVGGNVVIDGTLTVDGVPFSKAFVQDGNSFGTTAFLGTNDAFALAFETNNIARMGISSSGAVTVNAPTTGIGFAVTGNASSTASTITPGTNQTGLSIGTSGTATGLSVFNSATVNAGVTYPLFVGGTQVGGSALATTVRGAPRMIWAQIPAGGLTVTAQSGGISAVTNPGPGQYTITYDTFGAIATNAPAVVATANASGFYIATTAISTTAATLEVRTDAGVLTNAAFSVIIMGLAS